MAGDLVVDSMDVLIFVLLGILRRRDRYRNDIVAVSVVVVQNRKHFRKEVVRVGLKIIFIPISEIPSPHPKSYKTYSRQKAEMVQFSSRLVLQSSQLSCCGINQLTCKNHSVNQTYSISDDIRCPRPDNASANSCW
jgi:hypothetical protein